ncbi:MAG: PAS domain S-box protein [Pelagimonas sp.]
MYETSLVKMDNQNQMALLSGEELWQVFEQAAEAMYLIDAVSGRIEHVNEQALCDLGYSREELISMQAGEVVGADVGVEVMERLQDLRLGEKRTRRGFHRRKDASEFPVEVRVSKIEVAGQTKLLSLARDITEQTETLEQLRISNSNFRMLVENSIQSVAIANSDRQIVYANTQFAKTFGYDSVSDVLSSQGTPQFIAEADQNLVNSVRVDVLSGKSEAETFKFDGIKQDGSVIHLECTLAKATWDGEVATITSFRDITQQKQAEQRLHQAQRTEAIGQMTGGVAHDFNNLLAVILGNLELLRDEMSDEMHLKLVTNCMDATIRGAELTRNMLAFAKQAPLVPQILDLNSVVDEVRNWSVRTLPASIELDVSLAEGLWQAEVDKASLESALLNLILNAKDALPDCGRISIQTANICVKEDGGKAQHGELSSGQYVMLAVSDTGIGIPKEKLETIFEPFFTTKPVGAGSGLGLSMVQGFIEQSGGSIQVFSEPDVGTTFTLYFKATASSQSGQSEKIGAEGTKSPNKGAILVVEDQEDVLVVLVKILEKAGYSVTSAASGDIANKIFGDGKHFDLLVTDIVMPGQLQGVELSCKLRERKPELPVVFISGYAPDNAASGNGILRDDIRLTKPVMRKELVEAVAKALEE